jgi:hypothetical protein
MYVNSIMFTHAKFKPRLGKLCETWLDDSTRMKCHEDKAPEWINRSSKKKKTKLLGEKNIE